MEYFTDENIIEPLMKYYKDYNYITYIMNLPFKSGFTLYLKCIDNITDDLEKESKDRLWSLWLVEIQNGCKQTFEDYYKQRKEKSMTTMMTKDEKEVEEQRIIKETEERRKNIKLVRR